MREMLCLVMLAAVVLAMPAECMMARARGAAATAKGGPVPWRYTMQRPEGGWMKADFDDSAWKEGPAGFGAGRAPGVTPRTPWDTPEIWLRRAFEIPGPVPDKLCLDMYHDEDAEVYVNGVPAAKVAGFTKEYRRYALSREGLAALKPGRNVLAVHCKQTRGGQFIDVGIVAGAASDPPAGAAAKGKPKAAGAVPSAQRGPAAELRTPFTKDVTAGNAHAEYPRPQMVRPEWRNLNGLWDYAIVGEAGEWTGGGVVNAESDPLNQPNMTPPAKWDGKVLVPFCVESALSGVGRIVRPNQLLWYRRTVEVPEAWAGRRLLLHFGAVDWHAAAWVNGVRVGEHKGGYDPFTFDVTDALGAAKAGRHEVLLCVWDPTNMGDQAVGKQSLPERRRGFRYTPTTGIWQTVWMEPVGRWRIDGLRLTPDVDARRLIVRLDPSLVSRSHAVDVVVLDGDREVARATGLASVEVPIPNARLWSPDDPFLYGLRITLRHFQDASRVDDEVTSYFGMRKVSLGADAAGFTRIRLNNEPVFQLGPLDQGFWPDGIHTPASDAAAAFDVEFLRRIGCNMARVHVKVHPARWYYHCDRLGLLVWQDMVCTRKFDSKLTPEGSAQWEVEQRRMIDHLHNHPSVIMWIVFNEGWGQYDTERLTQWAKEYDPTRLVNNASGWTDCGVGDVLDVHDYTYRPSIPVPQMAGGRALLLGECGGFNRQIDGHVWYPQQQSPARIDYVGDLSRMTFETAEQMEEGYTLWVEQLRQMRHAHGLNAAVYTQITDVEHELNGYLTYDRQVPKLPVEKLRAIHSRLYGPAPKTRDVIPAGGRAGQWKYSFRPQKGNWYAAGFDEAGWAAGQGPFGKLDANGLAVGTTWDAGDIYLRKSFSLDRVPRKASLRVYLRGGCEVYLNGEPAQRLAGRAREDRVHAHDVPLRPEALKLLREGGNVLAVHCGGYAGPRYLDVGLIEVLD